MEHFTSLILSQKLKEAGCKIEFNKQWFEDSEKDNYTLIDVGANKKLEYWSYDNEHIYPAYDIMWDICVVHADKFFSNAYGIENHPKEILSLLKKGDKKGAEKFIWDVCVFNPKNKD